MSTGAIAWSCSRRTAAGSSDWSASRNSRRVASEASGERGRHAMTIDDAKTAAPPAASNLLLNSVRTGQVPVTCNPASTTP